MRIGGCSHPGKMRENNEDSFLIIHKDEAGLSILAVADGMGGHNFGEVASRMAVNVISDYFDTPINLLQIGKEPETILREVIQKANQTVFQTAQADETMQGMGTTLVLAIITEKDIHIGHVGDSRAYLYRQHQLTKMTTDHSFVEELVNAGKITPEEARVHPNRNIITRALGGKDPVDVDYIHLSLEHDDMILLCSDGLTNMVSEETMAEELAREQDLQDTCETLVRLANENGGEDNITVVICKK